MTVSRRGEADGTDGLGIKKEDRIVVYDSYGVFSSPRTAWTFKVRSLLRFEVRG